MANPCAAADDGARPLVDEVVEHAKAAWDRGAVTTALEILDHGLGVHPEAVTLHKVRGDILSTFRNPQEAVQAYDRVLAAQPAALDVRWAKWGLLVRWGQEEEAIAELHNIARIDAKNPLIHWRLAQELRKLDRLEESLESYKQAVQLMPDLLSWRLALARARFDVLDYQGADADLHHVLQHVAPGSPLELPAKNQLAQLHESMERGRRFQPALTPAATATQLKEWAAIRSEAWKLFEAGRFQEAEPIYRRLLALNPGRSDRDPSVGADAHAVGAVQGSARCVREPVESESQRGGLRGYDLSDGAVLCGVRAVGRSLHSLPDAV